MLGVFARYIFTNILFFDQYISHRIHVCYMVTWIPSIYPLYVSIYKIHGSYGYIYRERERMWCLPNVMSSPSPVITIKWVESQYLVARATSPGEECLEFLEVVNCQTSPNYDEIMVDINQIMMTYLKISCCGVISTKLWWTIFLNINQHSQPTSVLQFFDDRKKTCANDTVDVEMGKC